MKTIETVYNKLNKAKTELATHKIELGLVDDLKKITSDASKIEKNTRTNNKESFRLRDVQKEIDEQKRNLIKELTNDIKKGDSIYKKLNSTLEKAFKISKELGINTNEIKGFNQASDQLARIVNATDSAQDAIDAVK